MDVLSPQASVGGESLSELIECLHGSLVPLQMFWTSHKEGHKWHGNEAEATKEPLVKVGKVEKMLALLNCLRCGSLHYGIHLCFLHRKSLLT